MEEATKRAAVEVIATIDAAKKLDVAMRTVRRITRRRDEKRPMMTHAGTGGVDARERAVRWVRLVCVVCAVCTESCDNRFGMLKRHKGTKRDGNVKRETVDKEVVKKRR